MKYYNLNKNEKELLKHFEEGKFVRIRELNKTRSEYQNYAKATLKKTKNINIRLSEGDLQRIKSLAAERGIAYQTLVSSLIHQYSTGRIKELVA